MAKETTKKTGKSEVDFRAAHDKNYIVPLKIQQAIKALGPSGWEYELPFMKLAGLSTTDLALFRPKFEEFTIEVGSRNAKRVWCGSKALAAKFRAMV